MLARRPKQPLPTAPSWPVQPPHLAHCQLAWPSTAACGRALRAATPLLQIKQQAQLRRPILPPRLLQQQQRQRWRQQLLHQHRQLARQQEVQRQQPQLLHCRQLARWTAARTQTMTRRRRQRRTQGAGRKAGRTASPGLPCQRDRARQLQARACRDQLRPGRDRPPPAAGAGPRDCPRRSSPGRPNRCTPGR